MALLSAGVFTLGATGCHLSPAAVDAESQSAEDQSVNESANESAEGVNKTLAGELTYLAPQEYLVENQAFHVDELTDILCGIYLDPSENNIDENGYATGVCSYVELEDALEEGDFVVAEVVIVNGVAETITEYQY